MFNFHPIASIDRVQSKTGLTEKLQVTSTVNTLSVLLNKANMQTSAYDEKYKWRDGWTK